MIILFAWTKEASFVMVKVSNVQVLAADAVPRAPPSGRQGLAFTL